MRIPSSVPTRLVALALVFTAGGCASGRIQALETRAAETDKRLKDMQKAYAGQSVAVEDMETRIFLMQDELDTLRKHRPRHEELPVVRVRPRPRPRPRVAVSPPASSPVKGYDQLTDDGRVVGRADKAAPRTKSMPSPARQKSTLSKDDRTAASLYKSARAFQKSGKYEDAIEVYTKLVENYPNHGLADNAVYWIGECYYVRGLWHKALSTFQMVIANYPLGNKASDAMFKLGMCYWQLRDFRQSREVWEQLRDTFPGSSAAQLAAARLEQAQ